MKSTTTKIKGAASKMKKSLLGFSVGLLSISLAVWAVAQPSALEEQAEKSQDGSSTSDVTPDAIPAITTAAPTATATTTAVSENSPELILRVKPKLCLRYSSGETCELSVQIEWRNKVASNYCLHSAQDDQSIHCWEGRLTAIHEEERSLSGDLTYWLSEPGKPARLVEAQIQLATIVEDDKRQRTKRRHVWNLI